jgi:DNA-binding transcriptional MerR regulator
VWGMVEQGRPLFSIGAVSRMIDVSPATIRTWETRYALVVPQRSQGGQRLYSRDQVQQLRFVREEVASGRRPAEAHRLLQERVGGGGPLPAPPRSIRILIAETDLGATELLRELVGTDVFEVALAPSPEDALQHASEVHPALAIVDTDDTRFAEVLSALRERGAHVLPARRILARAFGPGA